MRYKANKDKLGEALFLQKAHDQFANLLDQKPSPTCHLEGGCDYGDVCPRDRCYIFADDKDLPQALHKIKDEARAWIRQQCFEEDY